MRRAVVVLAVGLLTVLAGCGASTPAANLGKPGPVNVGVIGPFTGSAASFGPILSAPCDAGTLLINKAGGVLGHKFQCTPVDDTGDPADAVPNVTRAIATISNFDMAVGLESNTAATTIPLVNKAQIPFVTSSGLVATNHITDKYYWRLSPADNAAGAAFAAWAVAKGYKKMAVIFENNIGYQGNLPGVLAAVAKLGGKITINSTIPADASSYSSVVASVISSHPQALIFSGDTQTTATFLANYSQLNNGQIPPMITATDSLTPDFFGAVAKVVGSGYILDHMYLVGTYSNPNTPGFAGYLQGLEEDPRTHKDAQILSTHGPSASLYDGINILALAMLMAKSVSGPVYDTYVPQVLSSKHGAVVVHSFAEGKKALAKGKKIQYVGIEGPVTFNRYHNFAGPFGVSLFTQGGTAHRQAIISGAEISRLLG